MITLFWIVGVLLTVALGAAVRLVPSGQCLVVLRGRSVRRVNGSGLTALVPVREHAARYSLDPQEIPLVIHAVTRDDGEIVVLATMTFRVSDPAEAAHTGVAVDVTTGALAEEIAATAFASLSVTEVGTCPDRVLSDVVSAVNLRSALWGVTVESLTIDEVDLRLVSP